MRLFGLLNNLLNKAVDIVIRDRTRTKAIPTVSNTGQLASAESLRGWWPIIRESLAGAWQQNTEITVANVTTHPTLFACVTLISGDIAKQRIRVVQQDQNDIWTEREVASFSPVLRKPNHYQTRIQFYESWLLSKLLAGNTYVLKVRDQRSVVTREYILDPMRVRPMIAEGTGEVFYELKRDALSQLPDEAYMVPATEIIHDRFNCLFHPLVGLSPIYACGLVALQGLNIMNSSTAFFGNGATPGGVILVPGEIEQPAADRIKAYWETEFAGQNSGKVALLTGGMEFEQMKVSAVDSQLIEQLNWSAEQICSVFHVPPYMVGVGDMPNYNNIEALNQQYYSQCLQRLIEDIELLQDEGLGLTEGEIMAKRYGTEFDIGDLLRMDTNTQLETLKNGRDYFTPNDGRKILNLPPVTGGDTVYRQQQDFSLAALSKRDAKEDPFVKTPTTTPAAPKPIAVPSTRAATIGDLFLLEKMAQAVTEDLRDLLKAS